MKKQERALKIQAILNQLYPSPQIPLNHSNTYTLLIAVILSAQCTDKCVNSVTKELFSLITTPEDTLKLSLARLEELIRPCGLAKRKSLAILALSKKLLEDHSGCLPDNFPALEALPGVGHKTASVVLAEGFAVPTFPIDRHIQRCAKRWKLSSGKSVLQTEKDLKKAFPKEDWNKLHLQIIYFARERCQARFHDVAKCPICSWI